MTAPHWLALYGTLLAAWTAVVLMATPTGWGTLLRDLCLTPAAAAGPGGVLAMWLIMSSAMMLPTALPAFATYDDIAQAHGTGGGGHLIAGYAIVWAGFSALAMVAQLALGRLAILDEPLLAAALLILAGGYQFSPLKDACLSKCRMPLTFFMGHWNDGPFRMGLRLGATCLGCCWALMALGLIGGAMSLGFMALATGLMTLEKLSRGALVPRAIGLACLVGAGFLIGGPA
ncbi:Predicted metal-binding membrane protein [Jannaschia pohangensis]|uniref:Predicted metal-binding membrane protein n=2 Tax=Jannaschia pohangensis TaxID=390807 RepID=A0A1I3HIJ7_9RHOB|nr:Predicted metal-binding membrane protein [Jannaschia pohangensis]